MNTLNFRGTFALPALIALGMLANPAFGADKTTTASTDPTGSWLYTVTIPVDADPANNIVFQGLETYIPGGSYIETDQLSKRSAPVLFKLQCEL